MENKTEIKKANFDERVYFMGRNYSPFVKAVNSALSPLKKNDYAEKLKSFLLERSGLNKAVLFNSAEEAYYWTLRSIKGDDNAFPEGKRGEIIFLNQRLYDYVVPDIISTSNNIKCVKVDHVGNFISALSDKTAAVITELYSASGEKIYDKNFLAQISEICSVRNIAFIIDERNNLPMATGEFFSFTEYGIQPDVVIAGGNFYRSFSLGAVLLGKKIKTPPAKREIGSVACAGALALLEGAASNMDVIKERAKRLRETLSICKMVNSFCVFGLTGYADTADGKTYAAAFKEKGLKVGVIEDRIIFNLPVVMSEDEFSFGLKVIKDVLKGAQNPFDMDKTD